MVECANYLARNEHDAHVFTADWDEGVLAPRTVLHAVPARRKPSLLFFRDFRSNCASEIAKSGVHEDVRAGFGVVSPYDSVIWVQSVHKAWIQISARQRDWKGRLRQKLNPFHPYMLNLERDYFGRRRYRKLIALTSDVKSDLMRIYDIPSEDIVILPNGYSPTEFNMARRAEFRAKMRLECGYDECARVVVFVANELERKGFGPLLRAIASLNDPHIHLLVVGRVRPGGYLEEIDRLEMAQRVLFAGPTDDVARYYAAADVFALPTQYEAWGLVIVEAMACGLPALTSRLAGASIAIQEGVTGDLLDDPADVGEIAAKLNALLNGRHASPAEISQSVAEYSWDTILRRYEKILLDCSKAPATYANV
jgi:UDP-glucose:(heptosyl)LPS alpha-1,3-glucosyltransferase